MISTSAVEGQGFGDLDHLLLGHGQIGHFDAWIKIQAHHGEDLLGLCIDGLFVQHEADILARLAPDEHVLRHGEVRHQVEFLMDHADAQVLRGAWIVDFDFFALVEDATGIFAVDARQHFHQRGFASAVLTDQGVNFARTQLKLALAKGMHAGEGLFDPFHQN